MGGSRTGEQRALVRAAAERGVRASTRGAGGLGYVSQCRGTLAALDWIEGRRDVGPSARRHGPADDDAVALERWAARNHAEGEPDPGGEDRLFHDGAWSLLQWWGEDRDAFSKLSVDVPELPYSAAF